MQAGIAIDGIAQAANDLSFANLLALFYGAVYGLISRPYPVRMGDGNNRLSCHRADKRDNATGEPTARAMSTPRWPGLHFCSGASNPRKTRAGFGLPEAGST